MTRTSPFNSPLMLGFDRLEQTLEQVSKSGSDVYPPYNVVQIGEDRIRITLAVAGFTDADLEVTVEQNQLHVSGRQEEDPSTIYLHRGIAARQFHRTFLLAQGIEVAEAALDSGLLHVDLVRPRPSEAVKKVAIKRAGRVGKERRPKATQLTVDSDEKAPQAPGRGPGASQPNVARVSSERRRTKGDNRHDPS
jgi:HSP20 family molecular chaperone IbpA